MVSEILLCKTFVYKEKRIGWKNCAPYILMVSIKEPKTLVWNNQQTNFFRHCHIATFPPKNRSENFCRILEWMKRKYLRKLASNATDELKTCNNTKKRWCELIIDIFLTKVFKTDKNVQKKHPPFGISVFFHNKGFY